MHGSALSITWLHVITHTHARDCKRPAALTFKASEIYIVYCYSSLAAQCSVSLRQLSFFMDVRSRVKDSLDIGRAFSDARFSTYNSCNCPRNGTNWLTTLMKRHNVTHPVNLTDGCFNALIQPTTDLHCGSKKKTRQLWRTITATQFRRF